MDEKHHRDEEISWRTIALILEMLHHEGTTVIQHGEKITVSKCDEQDKDKGEDSPTSYDIKPRK